jgi:hypothetical protein
LGVVMEEQGRLDEALHAFVESLRVFRVTVRSKRLRVAALFLHAHLSRARAHAIVCSLARGVCHLLARARRRSNMHSPRWGPAVALICTRLTLA